MTLPDPLAGGTQTTVNCREQAISQVCAFPSPFGGIMSVRRCFANCTSRAADYFRRPIPVTDILSRSCSRSPHLRLMFRRIAIRSIWRPLRQSLVFGLLLVALTILCYRLHFNLATASLLYAAVVVFVSRTGIFFPQLLFRSSRVYA
jgi:hypothetical protein